MYYVIGASVPSLHLSNTYVSTKLFGNSWAVKAKMMYHYTEYSLNMYNYSDCFVSTPK